jgi:hypothetical protein
MGPVLYADSPKRRLRLFETNNPRPGSKPTSEPAYRPSVIGEDETGTPTIAGRDDPILTESPLGIGCPRCGGPLSDQ